MNKELLKKSIENIRLAQIKQKVDLEAELEHCRKHENPPLPLKERNEYYKELWSRYRKIKEQT